MPISPKVLAVSSGVYFSKKCFSRPQIGNAAAVRAVGWAALLTPTAAAGRVGVDALNICRGSAMAPEARSARPRKSRRLWDGEERIGVMIAETWQAWSVTGNF